MEPFIGMIVQFGGNFAPRGWALCDGQLLQISSNSALFAILGTTYGGDGKTTFGLPDLRSRVPIHAGQGPGLSNYRLGQKAGAETVTLTISNMPSHSHPYLATTQPPSTGQAANNALATDESINIYNNTTPNSPLNSGVIGNAGGSQPFDIVQPYLTINFIIALYGTFPSRN